MSVYTFLVWSVTACLIYLGVVFTFYVLALVISVVQHRFITAQRRSEDYDLLASSRMTIPVSVIAPVFDEAVLVDQVVSSLLALNYPEFELIVVNDGSRDDTLGVLTEAFALERRDVAYRKVFETQAIRGIYRSRTHPSLVVVDKENGGKADALNAGMNFARYRYVCTVDGDTIYYPDALLLGMRVAMRDPATVVGVTSTVAVGRHPENLQSAETASPAADDRMLMNFQLLDYLRSFLNNRVGYTRWNFMLCCIGVFSIWRRDLVLELGGFSGDFTCEDIEFTFRVHDRMRRAGRPYQILALPECIACAEGPDTVKKLVSQRARWQRVISETVWHYRRMLFNPRYGVVGMLGAPYYLIVEALAPVFQVLGIITLPLAISIGAFELRQFLILGATIAFTNDVLTNAALLLYGRGSGGFTIWSLVNLMAMGILDLFLYRPVIVYAQAKGVVDFFRGKKGWDKFERNVRGGTNGNGHGNGHNGNGRNGKHHTPESSPAGA